MSSNENSFLIKYTPKKISELYSNTKAVKTICKWLNDLNNPLLKNEVKSSLIIIGSHGIGKTISVKTILNQYNYNISTINFDSLKVNKNIKKNTDLLMNFSNVIDQINCNNKKKNAILIDELESISSSIEKSCILTLQKTNEAIKLAQIKKMAEAEKSGDVNKINQTKKINEQITYCPIIFISNGEHNKLLTELKKNALEVKFWQPTLYDTHKILINIATKEKIQFTNKEVANNILEHAQNDIRRTIFILQDLCETYECKLITNDIVNDYKIISKKKDIDMDLFKSTIDLLFNCNTITDCMSYYETEKVLLPLMIHQNYIPSIINNSKNIKKNFDVIEKISHVLSVADVIENYIYGDQNWDMQELHGLYTCGITSYHANTLLNKKKITKVQFPADLNKTSIKKINKKNILNTNKYFNNMNIFDYVYSNKIIKNMINNNDIKTCSEILAGYDVTIENIESLLKIDKISGIKNALSSKNKKLFSKYLVFYKNKMKMKNI